MPIINYRIALVKRITFDERVVHILEDGDHGEMFSCALADVYEEYNDEHPRYLKRFSPKGLIPGIVVKFTTNEAGIVTRLVPLRFCANH